MKAIDVTRVKKTQGGYPVRIYHADKTVIHGACLFGSKWEVTEWRVDGVKQWAESKFHLVEEPETVEVDRWMNVYSDGSVISFETRKEADEWGRIDRIACVHIQRTVTKGEGLDAK